MSKKNTSFVAVVFFLMIVILFGVFSSVRASSTIPVGFNPDHSILVGTKLYVTSGFISNMTVVDVTTNSVTQISGTANTRYVANVGNYVYATRRSSNQVHVVDTTTDTRVDTITLPGSAGQLIAVGSQLYVLNLGSDRVFVIDTTTNAVTENISGGLEPAHAVLVGSDLYVVNRGDASVTVIDTNTNSVTTSISVGDVPSFAILMGTNLYVLDEADFDVSIIDTVTNTVTGTIDVGNPSYQAVSLGTKVYLTTPENISIIDTNTNTVTTTVSLLNGTHLSLVGTKLYVLENNSNQVSVINTNTNTITTTISVGSGPIFATLSGTDLYILNNGSNDISVIDTLTDTVIDTSGPILNTDTINGTLITLTYDEVLDVNSVPSVSNFVVNVGFTPATISSVAITGSKVIIVLDTPVLITDTVTIDYIPPVTNKIQDVAGYAAEAVTGETLTNETDACYNVPLGTSPSSATLVGTDLYVLNNGSDDVSVIDTTTNTVTATIAVGSVPQFATLFGTDLYVLNNAPSSESGDVSVIDTNTNTVTTTISVGAMPYTALLNGTNIYVVNYDGTVSVIDTNTNTVTTTILVGANPRYIVSNGTNLYVANYSSNDVSVIDTNTNTVSTTTPVGSLPFYAISVGTDVYVSNIGSIDVSVIDTNTNTVTTTIPLTLGIPLGSGGHHMSLVGTDIYVTNANDQNIAVIDTTTNTVTTTISVDFAPTFSLLSGTDLYVLGPDSTDISVIDTTTNTVTTTVPAGSDPTFLSLVDSRLYVLNASSNDAYIIDTNTNSFISCPSVFVAVYAAQSSGSITGMEVQLVESGSSTAPVLASPGSGFAFASWSDASLTNPRSDMNVTSNLYVTAQFAPITTSSPVALTGGTYSLGGCIDGRARNYDRYATYQSGTCLYDPGQQPVRVTDSSSSSVVIETGSTTPSDSSPSSCNQFLDLKTPIRFGASNSPSDVRILEEYFNTYENKNIPVDGVYSKEDRDMVIEWQEKYLRNILSPWGITKGTGHVYIMSLNKMREIKRAKCGETTTQYICFPYTRALTKGENGFSVEQLQHSLSSLGFLSKEVTPNGFFGNQTFAAVTAFQKTYNISPTGKVGRETGNRLQEISCGMR